MLVDRLVARADIRQRLVDSLETCFREGHSQAVIEVSGTHASGVQLKELAGDARTGGVQSEHAGGVRTRFRFSERFECKYDGTVYPTPEPRLFSFNNPYGACPTCQGFGNTIGLDLDLVIPNPGLTLS